MVFCDFSLFCILKRGVNDCAAVSIVRNWIQNLTSHSNKNLGVLVKSLDNLVVSIQKGVLLGCQII